MIFSPLKESKSFCFLLVNYKILQRALLPASWFDTLPPGEGGCLVRNFVPRSSYYGGRSEWISGLFLYEYFQRLDSLTDLFVHPALFLSKGAPFNFPGFSIMCIGLASVRPFTYELLLSFYVFSRWH